MAIAKMSPGIVRFYFDSKAAMLVASLQFLAAEFEERVLAPVSKLRSSPVAALQLMVGLYLDPEIASPRKVSVWYAFWGEASSRQEYYDICGQKDESFARLVRELVEALIISSSQRQLDPDGIALGLIGALEMMWQEFAFKTEGDIDRVMARNRCLGYLRSVFPGLFPGPGLPPPAAPRSGGDLGRWAGDRAGVLARERERLFAASWSFVGHESDLPRSRDFLSVDIGAERALVVRDDAGAIHVFRNCCPNSPHALVTARRGGFDGDIECRAHGLTFSIAGSPSAGPGDAAGLSRLHCRVLSGLIFARSPGADQPAEPVLPFEAVPPPGLRALSPPREAAVAADWKIIVEQWLQSVPREAAAAAGSDRFAWQVDIGGDSRWSARCYRGLPDGAPPGRRRPARGWDRQFLPPGQVFEARPDGISVIQVLPASAGRCIVRRSDYSILPPGEAALAALYLAGRLGPSVRRRDVQLAESVQAGMTEFAYAAAAGMPVAPALSWFHDWFAAHMPSPALDRPANEP